MDLLRFLALLPVRLAALLTRILRALGAAMRPLFGSVAWSPPPWTAVLAASLRRHGRRYAYGGLAVFLTAGATWGGWQWYRHLPHPPEPERITISAAAPAITDYESVDSNHSIIIHPLEVKFSASAAPIEKVGKTVTAGITMEPALKGVWRWSDDRTLKFVPAVDWPVGAHIEIRFDAAQAFAPHVLMADDQAAFDMPVFALTAGTPEFYQDPQNPAAKKTIMPVDFNYPVDPAEFEKRLALALKGRDGQYSNKLKFTVTYDAARIKAWIHSQPLELPRDSDVVTLTVDKGVRSARGGDATPEPVSASVGVPGLYSLNVAGVSATLVDNDKFEPEQVLVMGISDAVRSADLAARVQAWVLPKRKAGFKQRDSEPPYDWSTDDVSDAVLRQSQPLKLTAVPTEKDYAEAQSFKFQAEPGQRIYVRIAAGLKSFGGYVLGKNDARVLTVPDYPKLLHFMADGSLLSLSGDKRISVVARNEPGMKLEIGRVLPDQLQHLVSFNNGSFSHPEFFGGFSADRIVERFVQKKAFPPGKPGDAHYEGVDLSQYLSDGRRGIFLLHLTPYDPARPNRFGEGEGADSRLIVVTDLGLLVKRALDGSRDVYVQSIRSGQPVGGVSVSVLALNGQTLFTQTSSADGVAHFPTMKGLERERRPVMILAQSGGDQSFLPIDGEDRKLDYSRFDTGGEVNAASAGELSAYLFSDRGIYRPGDLFHVGLIVRTASWAHSAAGIPLRAQIVDPRGIEVKRQPVTVDASGFAELDYTPAETAPTGTWTVSLYIVGKNDDDDTAIGSVNLSVKEFLPDSMKVDAGLSAHVTDGWVAPGALKGLVDVHNLFGTPATGRKVEASLTLNPSFPAFRAWPDFHFYDLRHAKNGYTTQLQDGVTDDKGHAEFDLDLKKYADATYRLDFLAKAYEAGGGRNVAASAETLVSSNPWLVGYKSADDLAYIQHGSRRAVRLVAIDPATRSIPLGNLTAQLIERRYVSVLTKQDSGVYKYESRPKEIPVSSAALSIPAGGMDYVLPTTQPGDFALLIKNGDILVNRIDYSVTGAANLSRALDRNAELQVKLDKSNYSPGGTIEVSLRAPYAGSGLITIERDKVYAHAWFHAATTNSVQHITVPKGFEGNGYINVQYVRDPASDEIFMSPLSYGVAAFSVNADARRDALTVEAPDLVKPGETATFKLHSAHPAKVVLFAVDEGILRVAHYQLGDPLKYFFRKRMLEVQTAQILDLILPDFKKLAAAAAPGGDGGDAIGRQLNPFKRKRDKPVAYWSGIVDVTGEKDFSYTVPDYFHGQLRVMAVAVSPSLIGIAQGATTVRGDFVLTPTAPTTLAPGDEAEIGVGVSNNLSGPGAMPVTVTLKTGSQLQVLGGATQTVALASQHEGVVTFRVRATSNLGSGNLTFTASSGGKSARQSVEISVRPAAAYRTQVDIARVNPGGNKAVAPLRRMYDPQSERKASISTVPLVLSEALTNWLVHYDNYCSEQIVSVAMPLLVGSKWSSAPISGRTLNNSQTPGGNSPVQGGDPLAKQIEVLRSRQNAQGGFGLWAATPESDPFISDYVMHFLLEARERGAAVPKDMIDAGNVYLQQLAANDGDSSMPALRERAYAVYLLTRQGNVTTNSLATVQKRLQDAHPKEWKNDLAAAWLAASYQLLKQDKQAAALIEGPLRQLERSKDDGSYVYGYHSDPLIRDSTVLYLLARHFPDRAKYLAPAAMENIVRPLENDWFNTLSAAMTMLALDAYTANNQAAIDKLGITETRADGSSKSIATLQNKLLQSGIFSGAATGLRFTNGSALTAWAVTSQAGYDRDIPTQAIKNGLEIVRDYTDTKGNPLTRIILGQEIDVHVKIRSTGPAGIDDIAIVDLLPGGFDPVIAAPPPPAEGGGEELSPAAPTVRLPQSSFCALYTDVREDRVVIYGLALPGVKEFVYRIKASSAGRFVVPPAYGESMYDRRIQARSPGGAVLTVARAP